MNTHPAPLSRNSKKGPLKAVLAAAVLLLPCWIALLSAEAQGTTPYARPTGHGYHALVYDSNSSKILLFGGQTGDIFGRPERYLSSDTWVYDPAEEAWQLLYPAERPPALTAHAMAFDAGANKTVLYGGVLMTKDKAAHLFRQTWTFDLKKITWKRVSDGPPSRYGHRMVGIAKSGVIVLFGGADVDAAAKNNARKLGDTWIYDALSDRWKDMKPPVSPSPRHYFGMAYDSKADRVIVWGGAAEESPDASSVWAYDLTTNTWTERKPASGPKPLHYVAMAYDPTADRTIIYGGNSEGSDETWAYSYGSNTWIRRFPQTNPGKRSRMPIVYVPAIGRTLLFGGQLDSRQFVYCDETWLYDFVSDSWEKLGVRRVPTERKAGRLSRIPLTSGATNHL